MTGTLFWKDLRLLRPVKWSAIVLGIVFYVVGPALAYVDWRRDWMRRQNPAWEPSGKRLHFATPSTETCLEQVGTLVTAGASMMGAVNLLLIATIAGMAFATERREGWADFAAMLPATLGQRLAAKWMASVDLTAIMLTVNAAVIVAGLCIGGRWPQLRNAWPVGDVAKYVAVLLGMTGVAWLLSSLLRSAVLSAGIGITAVVFVWFYVSLMEADVSPSAGRQDLAVQQVLAACVALAGVAGLIAGSLVQLWRRSP